MITERSVIGSFFERLQRADGMSWIDKISTPAMGSDQDSEDYAWLGQVPGLSAQLGAKKFTQLREVPWTVRNVKYQGGLKFPKGDILYDKTGQVMIRTQEGADTARNHWVSLAAPLVVNGATGLCYDGKYFFATDHAEGNSGTQSNLVSVDISALPCGVHGTITVPSVSEMAQCITLGIQQMIAFKDDQGEYCNEHLSSFLLMVPTTLIGVAMAATGSAQIDGGDSNILVGQNTYKLSVAASPRLNTWTDSFALFATDGMQRPIIRQQRVPNNGGGGYSQDGIAVQTLWLDSEHCKLNDECLLSVETERAAAYGDWKKAVKVTMT